MFHSLTSKIIHHKTELLEHALATSAAVVSRLSLLFITLINTQYLSPSEFGMFTILMLIANIVNPFVSCGGDMWLNRFTRRRHANFTRAPIVARFYMKISAGLVGLVAIIALGFAIFGRNAFDNHGLAIAFSLLWAASAGMIETILAILRTTNDLHRFFIIRDLLMPVILILSIVLLKMNTCLEFFLVAFLLWLGTLVFLLKFILSRSSLYLPKSYWTWKFLRKGLMSYTAGLILNNFSARLMNGFDTLILTHYLPIALVGRYRFVAHFSNAFTVVQHFVFLALPWHLRQGKGEGESNLERLKTVKLRQTLLIASAFSALLVLVIFAKPLLGLLGSEFQAMAPLFILFLLIRFSELMWGPQHEKLISNNRVNQDTIANIIGIVSGVSLFWISLYFFSALSSAVIASGVSSILVQGVRYVCLKGQNQKSLRHNPGFSWLPIAITLFGLGYIIQSELIQ